jgi:sec-independent protein translocase protein TatC
MQLYTFREHFIELKQRIINILCVFLMSFCFCYYYSDRVYDFLLKPLAQAGSMELRKVIYTGLAEAFFTYLKLAAFSSLIIIFPFITFQVYRFVSPGLHKMEKKIAAFILLASPLLFWGGGLFVFYYVMPKAWQFFLSFENVNSNIPIVLEAKVSEYLSLIIQLFLAFGLAFQLPIIILILNLFKVLSVESLRRRRRLSIVINFILAGVLTPPDVISQLALAMPLLLLYEISILMCKLVENRKSNVGH